MFVLFSQTKHNRAQALLSTQAKWRLLCRAGVKLLFPKGAKLDDPKALFNARLQSKDIRAIEFHEGNGVDKASLSALVLEAIKLNL